MCDVHELRFRSRSETRIWFSEQAAKDVTRFRNRGDPNKTFWKRLERCAANGFALYEQGEWPMVKAEWSGVYRFGVRDSLFRLIGFYEDDSKQAFIVMDTLLKKGQALSAADRARTDAVAQIKKQKLWRKVSDEEDFPRLAEGT
jgi:hypothetical protein